MNCVFQPKKKKIKTNQKSLRITIMHVITGKGFQPLSCLENFGSGAQLSNKVWATVLSIWFSY